MTDKQIFENEIKCITRRNECVCNGGSDCIKCDLLMDSEEIVKCYNRAINNINLTNRQKTEIERLNIELQSMRNAANSYKMHYEKAQAKIERLQKNIDGLNIFTKNHIKVIRLQAIKEFAERFEYFVLHEDPEINELKCKDYESYMGGVNQLRLQIVKGIDNLVNERF